MWGPKYEVSAHFVLKAQSPGRGALLPRTRNEAPWRPKDVAEDDFTSNVSQATSKEKDRFSARAAQWRKLPNTLMWSPAPDKPILIPCYSVFPNHSDVWIDKTSNHPKQGKNGHVCKEREENTSIKGGDPQKKGGRARMRHSSD